MRTNPKKWLLALIALALGTLFPGLALAAGPIPQETSYGLPRDVSADGHRIDWLIKVTLIFVTILFVIMVIWMLLAVFKHNHKHKAEYDHGDSRHAIMVGMILSAVIFFVVDGNLWVNATRDLSQAFWNFPKAEKHPEAVRIELNAHQWAWDARYAGPDLEFNTADDIVVLNDLVIPIDRPVIVQLVSTDVIHSFSLPNFRVKMDATPGMTNRFWFMASGKRAKPGDVVEIGCTQHCGTNHYKMRGTLKLLDWEAFQLWSKEASASSKATYDEKSPTRNWGWKWKRFPNEPDWYKQQVDAKKRSAALSSPTSGTTAVATTERESN